MQRDYKFSSVFIIQVISAVLIFLITLFWQAILQIEEPWFKQEAIFY